MVKGGSKKKGGSKVASRAAFFGQAPKQSSLKRILIVVASLVLVVGILIALYLIVYLPSTSKALTVCSNQILSQAAPLLDNTKLDQLRRVADNIKSQKNFDRDPNCLYVVTRYYVFASESENARLYLDQLKEVYDKGKGFNPAIGKSADLGQLEQDVTNLEKANSQGLFQESRVTNRD